LGVRYKRRFGLGFGLTWQESFQTTDQQTVNEICTENEMQTEWQGDELTVTWNRPAIQIHPLTREELWFNHAYFYHPSIAYRGFYETLCDADFPFCSFYGDGSDIEKSFIDEIDNVYQNNMFKFTWEKGDLLLVDNMLVAHGRNSYSGKRQILVAMFQ
jgi:alpha-ketoglutarate-dependent taurine dioxygenase